MVEAQASIISEYGNYGNWVKQSRKRDRDRHRDIETKTDIET